MSKLVTRNIEILGAGIGCGAQDQRTELAAEWLKDRGILKLLKQKGIHAEYNEIIQAQAGASRLEALPAVADFSTKLAEAVGRVLKGHKIPLVLGGDHSCAIGTWSGVASSMSGDLGLLWLDAHMDAHTSETSETGAIHGMPLAALLGFGDSRLSQIASDRPKLLPSNTVLLGIRSYEKGEAELLEKLGVRIYFMNEVEARGFQVCFDEAVSIVSRNTQGFGVTLDLDGFDPKEIPAVGSPVEQGFSVQEVVTAFGTLDHEKLLALEVVEYNPMKDLDWNTYFAICKIIEAAFLSQQSTLSQRLNQLKGAPVGIKNHSRFSIR